VLQESSSNSQGASATFSFSSSEDTLKLWPFHFLLLYSVRLSPEGLFCQLKAINKDTTPFRCHALLHTYFAVRNIHEITAIGYTGCNFFDKTRGNSLHIDADPVVEVNPINKNR
jgi:D-hexose-6-phosphate mutarotase